MLTTVNNMLMHMTTFMHMTTLILLAFLSIRIMRNLRFLYAVQQIRTESAHELPLVSILIPARNEGKTIRACVESLAAQNYPHTEILILDDQSTDDTYDILQHLAVRYPHVHVIKGDATPLPGWNGKSFACQRLAEQAKGDWLLFTDADTHHNPNSLSDGMAQANKLGASFLSAMPHQMTKSIGERILVSFIMDFLPLIGVDLSKLSYKDNKQVIANGQYVLVETAAYQQMGGHAAIIHELVDDFALAQQFVRHNQAVAFINGTAMLSCRMYHNSGEVWRGFTKNILQALQTNRSWSYAAMMAFAWGFVALFLAPYWSLVFQPEKLLSIIEILWLTVLRLIIGYVYRRPIIEAWITPLSALGVMSLGLNALYLRLLNRQVVWKDRAYKIKQ